MRSPQVAARRTPLFAFHAHLDGQTSDIHKKKLIILLKGGEVGTFDAENTHTHTHRPKRNGTKKAKHREKQEYQRQKKKELYFKEDQPT